MQGVIRIQAVREKKQFKKTSIRIFHAVNSSSLDLPVPENRCSRSVFCNENVNVSTWNRAVCLEKRSKTTR